MAAVIGRSIMPLVLLGLLPGTASAQLLGEGPEPRLRLGPLGVTPRLTISSRLDTNVFNAPTDEQRDVVADIRPGAVVSLRAGRLRFQTTTGVNYAYFRDYPGQGGAGGSSTAQLSIVANRLRPFVEGTYVNSNERLNFEIDERARRIEYSYRGGVEARLTPTLLFTTSAGRSVFEFTAADRTAPLSSLNRESDVASAVLQHQTTPLTRIFVTSEVRRERFTTGAAAEAQSVRVVPGAEFSPFALLRGRIDVGVTRFSTRSGTAPAFTGAVGGLTLSYVLGDRTNLGVTAARDLTFSFAGPTAYYLQNGVGASIGRAFGERTELRVTWNRQQLDYRDTGPAEAEPIGADLRVTTAGAQVIVRLARDLRFSLSAEHSRRFSPAGRGFEKVMAFTALTYGGS